MEVIPIQDQDLKEASEVINESFDKYVAQDCSAAGIKVFKDGSTPQALKERVENGNTVLVAKFDGVIVGVGCIRSENHLSLLFVKPEYQNRGIGLKLFQNLLTYVDKDTVTVNSSLNAVNAYERFGFRVSGEQGNYNGITYVAMTFTVCNE